MQYHRGLSMLEPPPPPSTHTRCAPKPVRWSSQTNCLLSACALQVFKAHIEHCQLCSALRILGGGGGAWKRSEEHVAEIRLIFVSTCFTMDTVHQTDTSA